MKKLILVVFVLTAVIGLKAQVSAGFQVLGGAGFSQYYYDDDSEPKYSDGYPKIDIQNKRPDLNLSMGVNYRLSKLVQFEIGLSAYSQNVDYAYLNVVDDFVLQDFYTTKGSYTKTETIIALPLGVAFTKDFDKHMVLAGGQVLINLFALRNTEGSLHTVGYRRVEDSIIYVDDYTLDNNINISSVYFSWNLFVGYQYKLNENWSLAARAETLHKRLETVNFGSDFKAWQYMLKLGVIYTFKNYTVDQ